MNRRRFLRGLGGVVVGLPFLESLGHRRFVRAQTVSSPRRLVVFFTCNGANMARFWPSGGYGALTDAHFPENRALYPLRGYKDKLLIPRNMHMSPMGFGWDPSNLGCDHQKGMGTKLTAAPLDGSGFAQGISLDQFVAERINPGGRAPMTLGVHYTGGGGTGSISYRGPSDPVTSEPNPRLAFQDLMGISFSGSGGEEVKNLLVERRKSVLDLVHADFETLRAKTLSTSDQRKLDLHFSTIRDLEKQLDTNAPASMSCEPLDAARIQEIQSVDQGVDVRSDAQFRTAGRMQMDLMALALACDHTRVATLQWGSGAGGPIFSWDDIDHLYNHHKLSHGNTRDDDTGSAVAGYEDMIYEIDRWYAGEFAGLLDRLNAYAEGDGTVLDQSAVMWINELSDGKAHDFRDLPCVIAGSCGGYLKQGRYVNLSRFANAMEVWPYEDMDAPHNMLLTTLANAVGAGPLDHFGDSGFGKSGELDALKA